MAKKSTRKRKAAAEPQAKPLEEMTPEEQILAVPRTCLGPMRAGYREQINGAFARSDEAEARRLSAEGREGCGSDINALILANPLDGQEHTVNCRRCGQEITYRAPLVETPVGGRAKRQRR